MSIKYIYSPIIYKTTNLVNGLIYIGQHYTSADDGYFGSGKNFKSILKEFGRENFIRETLEYCDKSLLNNRERYWIKKLLSNNSEIGYNKTVGGQMGWAGKDHPMFGKYFSEDSKRKMSDSHKGKKRTEESRRKQSETNKGFRHSEDSKRKMSEYSKGKKKSEYHIRKMSEVRKCKYPSKETKLKMSESQKKGEKHSRNKYHFYCSDNKDYWKDFTQSERSHICRQFGRKNIDTITYKGIIIQRILKNNV